MQNFSADILEFESLRDLLSRFVKTPLGQAELDQAEPISDRATLDELLATLAEAMGYLRAATQPQAASRGSVIRVRFDSIPDVRQAVALLRIEGAALDGKQIFELSQFLEQAGEIRSLLMSTWDRFPLLGAKAAALVDLRNLLNQVRGKVLVDGSLADDASVALNRLRREIEKQKRHIEISLERFLRAHHDDGTLQEDFVTIRDDRFVVPVVSGQQRKVQGVIHGSSGTGHTLFVEPLETIELNNELVRLREDEQREVYRILRELTEVLRAHSSGIGGAAETIGGLEFLFAKAAFGVEFECVIPRFSPESERRLILRKARHPLLIDILQRQRKSVVPISLTLDEQTRTLLISGPNTGGKTVSMKTVGLLALMSQTGLPVPAEEAEFPIFDQVLADIGDQQSLAESLSSFSAHMAHVREMLYDVTRDSLVLLDELGRATDPEEGGPLGVVILDTFRSSGAFTLASTHLMALKVYGANTGGVVNASMGFNEENLQPTYVLRLGAPGKSAGLEIAGRLGMPPEMIERARNAMSTQERDIAHFLSEMHQKLDSLTASEQELARKLHAVEERDRSLAREWEQKSSAKIREVESRCEAAISEFQARARETIEQIQESAAQRKSADQALRKVAKTSREFQEQVRANVLVTPTAEKPAMVLEEGVRVRLKGVREPARIRRKLSDNRFEVEAGFIKMQISAEDVEAVLPESAEPVRLPKNVSFHAAGPKWDSSYREINVIGKHAEEARDEVDKFLDSAAMASIDRVRIVHGFGMGVLRKTIAELLTNNPLVEKFYAASPAEGGGGATVVELK